MANQEKTALPEEKFFRRTRRLIATLSPEARGYIGLAVGLCLLLHYFGYFQFLKVAIGTLGLALIIWGTFTSKILDTLKGWFESVRRRLS